MKPRAFTPPADLSHWYDSESPWNSGFISLMRVIAARHPEAPPPGNALLPSQDPFRLGQVASLVFPPREIAQLSQTHSPCKIALFSLGVWGPNSVLPLHLSEPAHLASTRQQPVLNDFMDIFHHRALSLFYRAWFISQDTATLDDPDNELFSERVSCLTGLHRQPSPATHLPAHARLSAAPWLIQETRHPEAIAETLQHYFRRPFRVEEFVLQWISLPVSESRASGPPHAVLRLGDGAILGEKVMDRQHKFRLVIGPLTLPEYLSFTPGGKDLPVLKEWIRSFTGLEYHWDIRLLLAASEIPPATLNGQYPLGHAVWLERQPSDQPLSGICFEPEMQSGLYQQG